MKFNRVIALSLLALFALPGAAAAVVGQDLGYSVRADGSYIPVSEKALRGKFIDEFNRRVGFDMLRHPAQDTYKLTLRASPPYWMIAKGRAPHIFKDNPSMQAAYKRRGLDWRYDSDRGPLAKGGKVVGEATWVHKFNGKLIRVNDAPITIPKNALIKEAIKPAGYTQVTFRWEASGYKYQARWHTRTPGAPTGQGNTWVIDRVTPGNNQGKRKVTHILTSKNEWTRAEIWNTAIKARKDGTATPEQIRLLDGGHWPE